MKNIIKFQLGLAAFGVLAVVLAGFSNKVFASTNEITEPFGIFRITTGGRHVLSGKHEGQIIIEAARSDVVELVLDGFHLHNPNGPAIFAPRSRKVELILADGTINTISDGRHPNNETNAAIYIQHELLISGSGTLKVHGNFHHGIRTQNFFTINSGTIEVTAVGDALRGRDGVIIEDGTFSLTAGGDGIQSNRASDPERGFVTINGGRFIIAAGDDGIQAESRITINDGTFSITAHDDGITTNGSVFIHGGNINIIDSYEGIEGLNVTITGGDIKIFARDDGINARCGEISPVAHHRNVSRAPANENIYVRITGGNIHIHALGDGIDSNNNIFLEGGTVYISGPSSGREGAVDHEGIFLITGGELVTAGSVRSISSQSTQASLIVAYGRQLPGGTLIEVRNSRGCTLLKHVAQNAFSMSTFTSVNFAIGQTYALYINGEKTGGITLTGIVTTIGGNSVNRGFANARGGGRLNQQTPPRSR
ncbi:MAG: carbohydrate-binding domain-containing protein [Treponema sp.]|nr:carbohydrate-binding domain-containing protein [Treponema sp.]